MVRSTAAWEGKVLDKQILSKALEVIDKQNDYLVSLDWDGGPEHREAIGKLDGMMEIFNLLTGNETMADILKRKEAERKANTPDKRAASWQVAG